MSYTRIGYIYLVTNNVNQKQYVGKTVETPRQRWGRHCQPSNLERQKNNHFINAIKKYGRESFTVEVLEVAPIDQLNEKEVGWIERLGTYDGGYNSTVGGEGVAGARFPGRRISESQKEKVRQRTAAYWERWRAGQEAPRKKRKPYKPAFAENLAEHQKKVAKQFIREWETIGEVRTCKGLKYVVQCKECGYSTQRLKHKHRQHMVCKGCRWGWT